MVQKIIIAALLAAVAASAWCARGARHELALEQKDHAATRQTLATVTQSRDGWVAAYAEALDAANAQRDNAAACLKREAAARTDATERADIMAQALPAVPDKQQKVVDNATRKRAADRLNRVWP